MAVRFAILGPLRVEVDGVGRAIGSPRQRAILGVLLLNANRVVHADTLTDAVWGDEAAGVGSGPLQVQVSRLRTAIGRSRLDGPLVTQDPGYLLRADADSLDLLAFEAEIAEARRLAGAGDTAAAAACYRTALGRWQGRALSDIEGIELVDRAVEQLELARTEASIGWIEAELQSGRHDAILGDLRSLAAEHPYDERLAALQMLALYRAGRQADALAASRELRRVLDADLGLEPGPALAALELQILNHDPGLAGPARGHAPAVAAAPAADARARTLHAPHPPGSLIGREADVAEVTDLLGTHRLVTLTGPGGTGKTRLAIEVARNLDGALGATWFVDLSGTRDAALVPDTIVAALDLGSEPGSPAVDRLADALSERPALLVLDNLEQVLDAATMIARLLASSEHLRVLATSRSALRIRGEREVPVAPLEVPPTDGPADDIAGSAAVRLFVERARDAGAALEVTDDTAPRLAAICARLDGLPLAIELAAVRARVLGTDGLLERLGGRHVLHGGELRDLPDRQQTLRATIGWSHDLLAAREATLFRRLAVFAGGFALDAAEGVAGAATGDVLNDLEGLVAQSLVRRVAAEDGPPRYTMLETIREYALERLEHSDEVAATERRHAEWFLRSVEPARQGLRGPDALAWTRRLNADRDNLHAALAWTLAAGQSETGLRLAVALRDWWEVTGRLEGGRSWLDRLLATDAPRPDDLEAAALNAAGGLAFHQADYDRAESAFESSLAIRRRLDDPAAIAGSLGNLSSVASARGDTARAIELETQSLAAWRDVGDRWGIAVALGNLGEDVAEQLLDFDRSAGLLDEAITLFRELGDRRGLAWVLTAAGTVDLWRDDEAGATTKLDEALAIARELDAPNEVAIALRSLGHLALHQGDTQLARSRLLEALAFFADSDEPGEMAVALELLGDVQRAEGEMAAAARTWGCAAALRERVGAPSNARNRAWLATAHEPAVATLGAAAFGAAYAAGRALDARAIVAEVAAT